MAIQRQADLKRATELLGVKKHLASLTRDREGGDGGRESKKQKCEREHNKRLAAGGKTATATDADKKGDIKLKRTFLKCPTIVGPKHPCGAYYRDEVACAKVFTSGKCYRDHTPTKNLTLENKVTWFDMSQKRTSSTSTRKG